MKTFVLRDNEIAYYKKYAKNKGFTHIKLELEASFQRDSENNESEQCYDCDGDGYIYCNECDSGITGHEDNGDTIYCTYCDDGTIGCDNCGSNGYIERDYNEWCDDDVENYIRDSISEQARNAIVYMRCYNDGSVDTEVTFTMEVDDLEYAIEVIEAFNALENQIGNGIDTSNAGMHMAFLTSGGYPCTKELDEIKLKNFTNNVKKLLPALYFLGTGNGYSRKLHFRVPNVSPNKGYEYPAICTKDNAIEYRVFDTCYNKPEQILDNFIVMAKTLQFYDVSPPPVKFNYKGTLSLADPNNSNISNMYYTSKHIDVLHDGLKYIRPTYKTLKQLMNERNFNLTKSHLIKEQNEKRKYLTADYIVKKKRQVLRHRMLQHSAKARWYERATDDGIDTTTNDWGTLDVYTKEYLRQRKQELVSLREYIHNNIHKTTRSTYGEIDY